MSEEGRRWVGAEARDATLEAERGWVVWGGGEAPPAALADARPGDDIAGGIARGEGWDGNGWVVVLEADEADVDELVDGEPGAAGYAPYLMPGLGQEGPGEEPMHAPLRDDVAPRRKVAQPRPS